MIPLGLHFEALRKDESIRVIMSEEAVTIMVYAIIEGHPNELDMVLGSLAGAVSPEGVHRLIERSADNTLDGIVEGPGRKVLVAQLAEVHMKRMVSMYEHGTKKGTLEVQKVASRRGGPDDLSIVMSPREFNLLTLMAGNAAELFQSEPETFFRMMADWGDRILTPAERMSMLRMTAAEGKLS